MLERLSSETARDHGLSSCRSARSEVVVLWKTTTTGKQLSMTAAGRMSAMSCRAAVGLGLRRVDHGFSRSPPDRRKLRSTSKEKTTEEEKTAVDVVDVNVVVDVGGRLEQPRRLFFNC